MWNEKIFDSICPFVRGRFAILKRNYPSSMMKPAYFPRDDVEIARMTRCPSLNRAATGIKTIPFRSLASPPLPTSRGAIPASQLHSSLIHREHRTRTGVSPPLFIRRIVFRSRTTSFNDKSPGRLSKSPSSIGETVPITPFFEMKFKFKERRNDWKTVNECERRWIPFPPSWNEGGRERKGTRTTTTTTTTSTRRVVETGWSNFSQHFSSSSAQTRWTTLAEMQYPSWLRNGRGAFPWWCLLRRCPAYVISIPRPPSSSVRPVSIIARTFLFIFSPSPLFPSHLCLRYTHRLPILVALSRPRQFPFSRSAFQFIPFAGFASFFPLSLPHFRDIKPWFSRFDPTACHNTMARLQRRRQPRSSSLSRHRLLALIEHRVADCWLTEREYFEGRRDTRSWILFPFSSCCLWILFWKSIKLILSRYVSL